MTLASGSSLGPYVVDALIGSGGMGAVYRGRDTRLGRTVALKVLSPTAAGDPQARQRLEREARTVAALNHPNICVLHDVGRHDDVDFLVMEYVEGETLASRLKRGPLPIHEALRYAIEIADALDKAHQQGVIHRDVKPGNIMLTRSGSKLLDFGIATFAAPPSARADDISTRLALTAGGAIVGTVPYMAPEQLQGEDVDARADIFAFGAVVYEMLTGRRAFPGESTASIIGAILEREPPAIESPRVPPALTRTIRKCLAKLPEARWQSCRDLHDELVWIRDDAAERERLAAPSGGRRLAAWSGWIAAALIAVAAILWLTRTGWPGARDTSTPLDALTLNLALSDQVTGAQMPIVSPDGRHVAFLGRSTDGRPMIWLRALDSPTAHAIEGTAGASELFWSPDSQSIAFEADTKLKRISRTGRTAQTICDLSAGLVGGAWGATNVILFGVRGALLRVDAAGGTPREITTLDASRQENSHRWPHFLSDGRRFLFVARSGRPEQTSVYLGSLDGPPPRRLFAVQSNVLYSEPGVLIFARDGALVAQRIDADTFAPNGEALIIAERIQQNIQSAEAPFSISTTGLLVYRSQSSEKSELLWFDRSGKPIEALGGPPGGETFSLSPDGQRVAMTLKDEKTGTRSIWVVDVATGSTSRLTYAAENSWIPVWAPDGQRIAFSSYREGIGHIFQKAASGAEPDELLLRTDQTKFPHDWSRDGRHLAYMADNDIWALPLDGDRKPFAVANSRAAELEPRFSPDGKWLAYVSDESGAPEVWVAAFPPTGARWQLTTAGGRQPRWRRDGRELLFLAPGMRVMAVPLVISGSVGAGKATTLFPIAATGGAGRDYEVSADGQRILARASSGSVPASIVVVLDWLARVNKP